MATKNALNYSTGAVATVLIGNGVAITPTFSGTPTVTSIQIASGTVWNTYIQSGSFTPVVNFGGASTGITYDVQFGKYNQIGNLIFYTFAIQLTSQGSSTGNAGISGFPVASGGTFNAMNPLTNYSAITIAAASNLLIDPSTGTANFLLFVQSLTGGGSSNLTQSSFSNTTVLQGNGWYYTS